MNDPRLAGARIMRETACRHGTHVFCWTGVVWGRVWGQLAEQQPPDNTDCQCGAYSWIAWRAVQEASTGQPAETAG